MKTLGRAFVALLLVAVAFPGSAHAQVGFRVIVNLANPVTSLRETEVARLFLKKTVAWPTGAPVAAVDQERKSSVRARSASRSTRKEPDAIVAHWQTMVFSGRDTPPPGQGVGRIGRRFRPRQPGCHPLLFCDGHVAGVKVVPLRTVPGGRETSSRARTRPRAPFSRRCTPPRRARR